MRLKLFDVESALFQILENVVQDLGGLEVVDEAVLAEKSYDSVFVVLSLVVLERSDEGLGKQIAELLRAGNVSEVSTKPHFRLRVGSQDVVNENVVRESLCVVALHHFGHESGKRELLVVEPVDQLHYLVLRLLWLRLLGCLEDHF